MRVLVLASTSRWRRKLLEDAGLPAIGDAPDVDERALEREVPPGGAERPARVARHLARAKATAVADRHPGAWVLAADQVVHQEGVVFGKPSDPDDHLRRLQAMRGKVHELVTGWVLRAEDGVDEGVCVTRMHVRADLTDDELAAYVAGGEGSGCAGGYAAEGKGAFLFERIDGDWFNVIGLPLLDVMTALRRRGWRAA